MDINAFSFASLSSLPNVDQIREYIDARDTH